MKRKRGLALLLWIGVIFLAAGCAEQPTEETTQPDGQTAEEITEQPAEQHGVATETPIAMKTPTEDLRDVLWADDFSDVDSGWERYRESDGVLDYIEEEGVYQMKVLAENNLWWVFRDENLTDVIMSVDVWQVDGPDGSLYGLMCRYDPETTNGYVFLISNDGRAGIGLNNNGFQSLRGGEIAFFDVLKTGMNIRNTVEVSCVGETLTMSVNGEMLFELPAGDALGDDIGLAVATVQGAGTDVIFDDLTIYEP